MLDCIIHEYISLIPNSLPLHSLSYWTYDRACSDSQFNKVQKNFCDDFRANRRLAVQEVFQLYPRAIINSVGVIWDFLGYHHLKH